MNKIEKFLRKILGVLNKIDDILMKLLRKIGQLLEDAWQTIKSAFGVS